MVIDIGDGERVLLGRAPNISALTPTQRATLGDEARIVTRVLTSPSISGNHAALWCDGDVLRILDLDSKNGTWVRLTREPFSATRDQPVELRLAMSSATSSRLLPEAPRYLDRTDFGVNVAHAVRSWFARLGFPVRVWSATRETAEESPAGVVSIPLANGDLLFVQAESTVDASFTDRLSEVHRYLHGQNAVFVAEESTRSDGMILASGTIREVHRRVVEAALQHLPSVLLLGPSGAGKERLAAAFHQHLGRTGPLVAINCATLSRDRIVADLFGAEAGAYTDAKRVVVGAVERADGGTLFLDELGELPLDVQPMLLRFLETGEYQRLGAAGRPRFADVRLVGATNRDLRRMVREGEFREDLFFRLALEIIDVPPLRERFADVEAYLRSKLLDETSAYDALQESARDLLRSYQWPGNFREVMNFVRRLPRNAKPGSLDLEAVKRTLEAGSVAPISPPSFAAVTRIEELAPWTEWLRMSATAYMSSANGEGPKTWNDVSTFIEQFLKPIALAHLAGVEEMNRLEEVSVHRIAERVRADRGTVTKQLRRYFDEFAEGRRAASRPAEK